MRLQTPIILLSYQYKSRLGPVISAKLDVFDKKPLLVRDNENTPDLIEEEDVMAQQNNSRELDELQACFSTTRAFQKR